ncbi:Thg1 C terminal domain-containing protein [Russula earlei]|uniref:Thg1 C terminal domain-containing protein n=1 Tax=Russula earlei TaxID=71964 RepID=A0ACC0U0X8_9AGAM|nr:Thg1 C terminal domain-containing protein [Russula earlei]
MANSKFAYVRDFELPDNLLLGTFILLRIDGHSFPQILIASHRFTENHGFAKPNDIHIILAFGQSDEYSFLFRKTTMMYNRREAKITSIVCSLFTSSYIMKWHTYFPTTTPLRYPPCFDARIVLYPGIREVRDYFSWRQTDAHINNLYNTAFWALVNKGGKSTRAAHETLRGTASSQKHEMLYSQFNINYNALTPAQPVLSNGTVADAGKVSLVQDVPRTNSYGSLSSVPVPLHSLVGPEGDVVSPKLREKHKTGQESTRIALLHCDIIGDEFWDLRPYLWVEDC